MPVGELYIVAKAPEMQMVELKNHDSTRRSEKLEPLRLEKEVPVTGIVRDEKGKPIFDASVSANSHVVKRHPILKAILRYMDMGQNPIFQFW